MHSALAVAYQRALGLAMVAGKMGEMANDAARTELLAEVARKSKSQVEEILAQRSGNETIKKRDVIKVIRTVRAAQKQQVLAPVDFGLGSAKENSPNSKLLSPAQPAVTQAPEVSFGIAFTASAAFHQKLQKARDLLKHKHPHGNLEAVLEAPFAYGGSSVDRENIELLCRNHNALRARQEFSKARRLSGLSKNQ